MEQKFSKGLEWDPNDLTPKMLQFEKETKKNAIYRGKITGNFEYWMYCRKKSRIVKSMELKVQKIKITTKKSLKPIKPRVTIKVPPESICYENKRRGTKSKPLIEKYLLNDNEVKYNWTKGQLYVNNKPIGPPDTKYGRDMLTYAKQNKPHISIDKFRNWWVFNYDAAVKNNWKQCSKAIKEFSNEFGITV